MIKKVNYIVISCAAIGVLGILGGCGTTDNIVQTQEIQETQKIQEKTLEVPTDIQAIDETEQGELAKICSNYCVKVISKHSDVSKKVCNSFCDDVIQQCEKHEAASMLSVDSCIEFGMLKPLSEKYPSVKAEIDAIDAKAQAN